MASSSAAGGDGDIDDLKAQLYARCTDEEGHVVFRQEDLMAMNVIPNNDSMLLLQVIQRLVDERLLYIVRDGSSIAWMYRSVHEASKLVPNPFLHE
jgi:translation elongation factor EF-Tu-like GTPase